MTRRGYVVLIRGGDAMISGALADGALKGMAGTTGATSSGASRHLPIEGKAFGDGCRAEGMGEARTSARIEGRPLPPPAGEPSSKGEGKEWPDPAKLEADRIAREWVDRQRLKRDVGNPRTAEDYRLMTIKAAGDYGQRRRSQVGRALWQLIGMVVLGVDSFLAWEERCWRGET